MSPTERTTYVLVDGENIDATLGNSILTRRPQPDERPRWDRLLTFAEATWAQPVRGLFFLAANGELPMGFAPFLLKELIGYDWKFPAERRELEQQLAYLESLTGEQTGRQMAVFAQLRLSAGLEASDWVNFPGQFLEQLSAHLWATHQMDAFRAASETYVQRVFTA